VPITLPAKLGLSECIVSDIDECVQCCAKVELGRDYCPTCIGKMATAVIDGTCAWCHHRLSPAELTEGYCVCGKPLNNAPPLPPPESP